MDKTPEPNVQNNAALPVNGKGYYEGFSTKARLLIVACAACIAVANLGLAWKEANSAMKIMAMSSSDVAIIKDLSKLTPDGKESTSDPILRMHTLNTQVHLKAITNKQSIIILAMGSGFALIAVGFALFLIGADGAFQISGNTGSASIVASGTAPGLLCMLMAALLIATGVTRSHKLNLGTVELAEKQNNQTNSSSTKLNLNDPGGTL